MILTGPNHSLALTIHVAGLSRGSMTSDATLSAFIMKIPQAKLVPKQVTESGVTAVEKALSAPLLYVTACLRPETWTQFNQLKKVLSLPVASTVRASDAFEEYTNV